MKIPLFANLASYGFWKSVQTCIVKQSHFWSGSIWVSWFLVMPAFFVLQAYIPGVSNNFHLQSGCKFATLTHPQQKPKLSQNVLMICISTTHILTTSNKPNIFIALVLLSTRFQSIKTANFFDCSFKFNPSFYIFLLKTCKLTWNSENHPHVEKWTSSSIHLHFQVQRLHLPPIFGGPRRLDLQQLLTNHDLSTEGSSWFFQ